MDPHGFQGVFHQELNGQPAHSIEDEAAVREKILQGQDQPAHFLFFEVYEHAGCKEKDAAGAVDGAEPAGIP